MAGRNAVTLDMPETPLFTWEARLNHAPLWDMSYVQTIPFDYKRVLAALEHEYERARYDNNQEHVSNVMRDNLKRWNAFLVDVAENGFGVAFYNEQMRTHRSWIDDLFTKRKLRIHTAIRCLADIDPRVRAAAAREYRVELDTFDSQLHQWRGLLASDSELIVRQAVALETQDSELLRVMAFDADSEVRAVVAANPKTPLETLNLLLSDADADVRRALSRIFKNRYGFLEKLAADTDPSVRQAVAGSLYCNPPLLSALAQDSDSAVRRAALLNPKIEKSMLAVLVHDPSVVARRELATIGHLSAQAYDQLAQDDDVEVRKNVASNQQTPCTILEWLAYDPVFRVRQAVAGNDVTPPATLTHLAKDVAEVVRISVAGNRSTPPDTVATLTSDPESAVRSKALVNPNLPITGRTSRGRRVYSNRYLREMRERQESA